MPWKNHIPPGIQDKYEIHDYKHAAAILRYEFKEEFDEVMDSLDKFTLTTADILKEGGNESDIPKNFGKLLKGHKWKYEGQLVAKHVVDEKIIQTHSHKVDYMKGRIAFDTEWNSKDQTFDRDLYAFRAFFEYDKISLGILLTRSEDLNTLFKKLGKRTDKHGKERDVMAKYGASTTHMGKLIPRLEAGRNGGCPVLVFGITQKIVTETK